jgi:hypothetical protein
MSTLYVGNCTKQDHIFRFPLPEKKSSSIIGIPAGAQISIPDLSTPAIDGIVHAHEPYGFVDANSIDRLDAYVGYCYSIDKPISGKRLTYAVEHNMNVLAKRGEQMRNQAAVSSAESTENIAAQANVGIKELEISTVEATRGGDEGFTDNVKFVQHDEANSSPVKRQRGRPRKNA